MRIAASIAGWFKRAFMGAGAAFYKGEDVSNSGAKLTDSHTQVVWVYGCIEAIAETVSSLPVRIGLERGKTDALITSGSLVELFAQPHPELSGVDLFHILIQWLNLRGVAYVIATDIAGRVVKLQNRTLGERAMPQRLIVLNSDRVRVIEDSAGLLGYHYQSSVGDAVSAMDLLPSEVIPIRLPSPYKLRQGIAPAYICGLAASTDYAAARFMGSMMANNADNGLIVTTDQMLTDDQQKQIQAHLRERKRQAGTADRPAILFGGLKIERPPVTVADMQFLEQRKFTRQEICTVFRVPQEILGYTEDANRSVADAARLNFLENRIAPLAARVERAMAPVVRCFYPDGNAVMWFDVDAHPAMAAARRSRISQATALFAMSYPANTINDALDLGLPSLPWGDRGWLPFALQPAQDEPGDEGASNAPSSSAEPAQAPKGLFEALEHADRLIGSSCGQQHHMCSAAATAFAASMRASVAAKRRKLKTFFFGQRTRVLDALEGMVKSAGVGPIETRGIDDVFDEEAENKALLDLMQPLLVKDLGFGGAQVWTELAIPGAFELAPEEAKTFLRTRQNAITGVNQTTFADIKGQLTESLDKGESFEQMAARIRDVFRTTQQRAETIARTETAVAVNSGRFTAMEDSGVELKAWLSANLETSRPEHVAAEETYRDGIPMSESFVVGGELLRYPGDPAASPGNTINCQCAVLAVAGDRGLVAPTRFLDFAEWLSASKKDETHA